MHMKDMMGRFTVRTQGGGSGHQQALPRPAKPPVPAKRQNGADFGVTPPAASRKTSDPSELIALDDHEFGKY